MTPYLLDVNVLIALVRPRHSHHQKVMTWFKSVGRRHWATCALTEAGFVRVVSNPKFTAQALSVAEALRLLSELTAVAGHQFWPLDQGLVDIVRPFEERFFGHQQVTDIYLLGLTLKNKGKLVTFDRGLLFLAGDDFSAQVTVL